MRSRPRIIRKIIRSRRYGFKNYRAFRPTKRARFARNFRKFLRKSNKPELKWIVTQWTQNVTEGTKYSNAISAAAILTGTGPSNRVGRQVRLVKCDVNMYVKDNSTQSGVNVPTVQSYLTRCVVWSPRLSYDVASTYMVNNVAFNQPIDVNYVTIYKDFYFKLSPAYIFDNAGGDPSPAPYGFSKVIKFRMPLPRRAKFSNDDPSDSALDNDKDILYCLFIVENTPGISSVGIALDVYSKTWFYDA